MATKKINLGGLTPNALYRGSTKIKRCYLGSTLVWDATAFIDEPKIDPEHPLYKDTFSMLRLEGGELQGMTVGSGAATIVDNAFATPTPGTVAFVREAFPAANNRTFRVSALIKVDKTAGRYSRIGFASNTATPAANSPDVYVGHDAGSGIRVNSNNFATNLAHTVIDEAKLVDGAWYRVTVSYDNLYHQATADTNPGRARVWGAAEPVDAVAHPVASPWYPATSGSRHDAVGAGAYTPMALVARTNSGLGTIRDLRYTATLFGANSDDAPITLRASFLPDGSYNDDMFVYSKGKAAPLRIIVAAGGSGVYGGSSFAHGYGRAGHPYEAFRTFWRDLANLGYTVLHSEALHEGWGADDHLAKQLAALNAIQAENYSDARIYYLGYSMGGLSAWRAIMGRAGFPPIRAAYIVAGASQLDMFYDSAMFSAIKTRWPDRGALDEMQSWAPEDLIARGTRVRMVTSTADINVAKATHHDPMVAKFAAAPELISELVHEGLDHFHPSYWNAADCVAFFEGADL